MPKKTNPKEYFIAGGVAGVVSRTCIAPVERVKILYQVARSEQQASWLALAPRILREEGVLAFWKGNTAAVMRVVPYMSITFLSYEEFRARLQDAGLQKQAATLAGGSLAGVTAVALTYPLDLARATMAMPGTPYTSMADALARTAREHGIGAWYRGMGSTIVGVAPYNALKFGAYEALKALVGGVFGRDEATLRPWQRVGAGALAGLLAQTAVYPLDVVRRRSQTHRGATPLYTSPVHALRTIAAEEGIARGLYRGLTINWLKTAPNVAIYMSLYDIVKMWLVGGSSEKG